MFEVKPIPIYRDNYVWVVRTTRELWLVDPGDSEPVLEHLRQQQWQPNGILITHHHWDHVNGVQGVLDEYRIPVYGPDKAGIPGLTHPLKEGDAVTVDNIEFQVMALPGHTRDHLGYHVPSQHALFCGDTLFAAGCGRIFDGSLETLFDSLQRLRRLPAQTRVYCAHEYTLANIHFAMAADPHNPNLRKRRDNCQFLRDQGKPTLPSTIGDEIATNPFLRSHLSEIQNHLHDQGMATDGDAFTAFKTLREWKNRF